MLHCLSVGVDAFATKPINLKKLQEVIGELFANNDRPLSRIS
jgi:CheY-like chemotaxis protein